MNLLELLKPPDLVSLMNLVFGVAAISLAHAGNYDLALILLLLAAVADGVDGFVARKFGGGKLGEELDSLADAVSFGVAPALLICFRFGGSLLTALVSYFYIVCGVLRLARYNAVPVKNTGFQGLPITAGCVVLASYMLIDGKFINEWFLSALTLALALLMASAVKYPKVRSTKALGFIGTVFGATVIMFFVDLSYMRFFSLLLFGLMLTYLISPFIKFPRKYYE
ncbi:MAG: archaetidylserine synthase [Methanosarcinaceae archaeon]|nr:archaetidylserine synthase [Methanosarcinaceae archaeon]MDD4498498.1 archaetidylserine synthase [Methanosarcinaceae archaeon]